MLMESSGTLEQEKASTDLMEQLGESSERMVAVPREEIWDWLPRLRLLFQSAVARSRGEYTSEDLAAKLLTGEAQLLVGKKGDTAFVHALVEFDYFPRHKALTVFAASGMDLPAIVRLMPQVKYYALANGATQVRVHGRKGWKRPLAAHGFKEAAILLTWDVNDGRR